MVGRRTTYTCDKCAKEHWSYDEAKRCETGHIVDEASKSFKEDLDKILSGVPSYKTKDYRP